MTIRATSKLGPHCLGGSRDAVTLLREGLVPVIKCMNDYGLADVAASLSHKPLVIGRKWENWFDAKPLFLEGHGPETLAATYLSQMHSEIVAHPNVAAWEGPNEMVFGDGRVEENQRAMAWFGRFEAERARILRERYGKAAVVGNFATGNPDLPEADRMALWKMFWPAIDQINHYGGYLGLHEYWHFQRAGNEGWDTWLPLRYRHVAAWLGEAMPKVVITECGWDGLPGDPPGASFAASGLGVQDYLESLAWYDRELQKDAYVVGATVFTFGATPGWEGHNVEGKGLAELMVARARQSMYDDAAPAPIPAPAPERRRWVRVKANPRNENKVRLRMTPGGTIATAAYSGTVFPVLATSPRGAWYRVTEPGFYGDQAVGLWILASMTEEVQG